MSRSPPYKRSRRNRREARKKDDNEDTKNEPSAVVFIHGLKSEVTEADFHDALSQYGPISYVLCMGEKALVEFESVRSARECVMDSQVRKINIVNNSVTIKFSKSEHIRRSGLESQYASNVLVLSVYNVNYPITVDVIHQIASIHGRVMRIALINKKGVRALLEFDSVAAAKSAKQTMNGADIYSGCCTLKVEFSKVEQVKVTRNCQDQWDYTVEKKPPLLGSLPLIPGPGMSSAHADTINTDTYFGSNVTNELEHSYYRDTYFSMPQTGQPRKRKFDYSLSASSYLSSHSSNNDEDSIVLMFFGILEENFNCDRIFNLVCSYGDCLKVKFLNSIKNSCMVEMRNHIDADNVIKYLRGVFIFGTQIDIEYSHKKTIVVPSHPTEFTLPDGTPYYKCFNDVRNWRFNTPELARKNRLTFPTSKVHFYSAPISFTDINIINFFQEHCGHAPISILSLRRTNRSCAGFVEFRDTEAAIEAVVVCNHIPIYDQSSPNPYVIKLSFAS